MARNKTHPSGGNARLHNLRQEVTRYFTRLDTHPRNADGFFQQWQKIAGIPAKNFSYEQLSLILNRTQQAYFKFGRRAFERGFRTRLAGVIGAWTNHAIAAMPKADAKFFSSAMNDLAALAIMPPDNFIQALGNHAPAALATGELSSFTAVGMGFSRLGRIMDPVFKAFVLDTLDQRMGEYGPGDRNLFQQQDHLTHVTRAIWTLFVQDVLSPDPRYKQLAQRLADQAHLFTTDAWVEETDKTQMRDACLWFDIHNTRPKPSDGHNTVSRYERNVTRAFETANVVFLDDSHVYLAKLGKKTDMVTRSDKGLVRIEADGRFHFVIHPDKRVRYNGNTLSQTALMSKLYPNDVIVRIPGTSFRAGQKSGAQIFSSLVASAARLSAKGRGPAFVAMPDRANHLHLQTLQA